MDLVSSLNLDLISQKYNNIITMVDHVEINLFSLSFYAVKFFALNN
jgi:hypothetical protein